MSTCLSGLDLLPTFDDHKKIVAQHIHDYATQSGEVEILEAGCGSGWPYSIPDIKFKLTGVDLDQNALDNRKRQGDLDECILGDLRTAEFHDESFDIIYSRFVLEHIQQAEIVLDNFNRWLKPNGLLIIMFPDRESVYSFFTRNTPFLVHILFKKYILGLKNAGRPGYGPYPTFSDEITGRMRFRDYVRRNNLTLLRECGFLGADSFPYLVKLFMRSCSLLGMGKSTHTNLLYIIRK